MAAKLVLGVILLIVGLYVIWQYTWDDFKTVAKGIVPPLMVLFGAFIVWLEVDELKLQKETNETKRKK